MMALALRCITVYHAAAESLGATDVSQHGRKRSEATASIVPSVLVAVESGSWYANHLKTISRIIVHIARQGPFLVSCWKDVGSASVTGSAQSSCPLQKMVGDISRAMQALPSEFSNAAAWALPRRCGVGGKCRRTASAGQT